MELQGLISKLEKATGGHWDLDLDLFETVHMPEKYMGSPVESWSRPTSGGRGYTINTADGYRHLDAVNAPNYTYSLDVALSLVPRGWIVEMYRGFDDDGEHWCKVVLIDSFSIGRGNDHEDRREVMAYGPGDLPRIVCIAALKAIGVVQ